MFLNIKEDMRIHYLPNRESRTFKFKGVYEL